MKISIITLFQQLYVPFLSTSLVGRAQERGLVSFASSSLFDYGEPKKRIDAPIYGHGAGMLIRPDVIERAIDDHELKHGPAFKIFFSPHGELMDQDLLGEIVQTVMAAPNQHVMLLPARYEGFDERVETFYADKVLSVGNFVLMGGDLPAMMFIEALLRLIPGVVGKQESVEHESFSGAFVDYPHYTVPLEWKEMLVPEVVRSGNHGELKKWRKRQAIKRTIEHHFDWLRMHEMSQEEEQLVLDELPPHYAVLLHSDVVLPKNLSGTTSVTSIDIHDIARSTRSYGLKGYFLVTPLEDQQKIIKKLLDFWQSDEGGLYNKHRQDALESVHVASTLDDVVDTIKRCHGEAPVLIGTSARASEYFQHHRAITYFDQKSVWSSARPVLFVFGTGRGLSSAMLERCDFMLPPLRGFGSFNHLSVRSAAAVILDRWLGHMIKKYRYS